MTRSDLLRRTLSVLGVVACLLLVAGVAQARFTAPRSGAVSVSTASMVAPTNATGTYQCHSSLVTEGITFNVASFIDNGPGATSYRYRVFRGGDQVYTTTSTLRSGTVAMPLVGVDVGATTWTLTIESVLHNWTSPAFSTSVTCSFWGSGTGSL